MTPVKISDGDAAVLREIAQLYRQSRRNTPNLESDTELVSVSTDVYVARTGAAGIPRLKLGPGSAKPETGTGSGYGDMPGSATCDIYRLSDVVPQRLQRVFYNVSVYNLSRTAVAAVSWVLVARDKFGTWYVLETPPTTCPPPYCPPNITSGFQSWYTKCIDGRLQNWFQWITVCPTASVGDSVLDSITGCCDCGTGTGTFSDKFCCPNGQFPWICVRFSVTTCNDIVYSVSGTLYGMDGAFGFRCGWQGYAFSNNFASDGVAVQVQVWVGADGQVAAQNLTNASCGGNCGHWVAKGPWLCKTAITIPVTLQPGDVSNFGPFDPCGDYATCGGTYMFCGVKHLGAMTIIPGQCFGTGTGTGTGGSGTGTGGGCSPPFAGCSATPPAHITFGTGPMSAAGTIALVPKCPGFGGYNSYEGILPSLCAVDYVEVSCLNNGSYNVNFYGTTAGYNGTGNGPFNSPISITFFGSTTCLGQSQSVVIT
jgi:hypothetical protein